MGALARWGRRGAAARAGLPLPPFSGDLVGAWHWSEGVTLDGSDVDSWESYAGRSTYTISTNTTPHPTVGSAGLDFADAGMVGFLGAMSNATFVIDFVCTSTLPDASNIVRVLSLREIGTNNFGVQHQQAASPAQTVLNCFAFENGQAANAFHPLLNPEVPEAMVDGCFAASYASGAGLRSRTLRRLPPASTAYEQGLSSLGAWSTSDVQFGIGRWAAGVFAGTIKSVLVYDRASSQSDMATMIAYLEALR